MTEIVSSKGGECADLIERGHAEILNLGACMPTRPPVPRIESYAAIQRKERR
jgi:hypothetical protein